MPCLPLLLFTRGKWHCYYTAFPAGRGYVFCAGRGPFSCECPYVNVCAPEILLHEGKYYLAALEPGLDGIRIARLRWLSYGRARFDFGQEGERRRWKLAAGDVPVPFARSDGSAPHPKYGYFVSTAVAPGALEKRTGVVESPEFEVGSADCLLLVRGGGAEGVYVAVVDPSTGEEHFRVSGREAKVWVPALADCGKLAGRPVRIRVVDNSQDPGGWIEFGGLWEHTSEGDR